MSPFDCPDRSQAPDARPRRGVHDDGDIVCDGLRSLPAFGQLLSEQINEQPNRAVREMIDVGV